MAKSENFLKCLVFFSCLLVAIFIIGCMGEEEKEGNSKEEKEEEKILEEFEELERELIEIIRLADLEPVLGYIGIDEEEKKGEEEKEINEKNENNENNENESDNIEFSFEKTLVNEIVIRELENDLEYPDENEELWDKIKDRLVQLHDQWNGFKPLLLQKGLLIDDTASIDNDLDELSVAVIEENYFDTIFTANKLTGHLPELMIGYVSSSVSITQELKYLIREIPLIVNMKGYKNVREKLKYMNELVEILEQENQDEDIEDNIKRIENSLSDLKRAVEKEKEDLIKIKAAQLMGNTIEVNETLKE